MTIHNYISRFRPLMLIFKHVLQHYYIPNYFICSFKYVCYLEKTNIFHIRNIKRVDSNPSLNKIV